MVLHKVKPTHLLSCEIIGLHPRGRLCLFSTVVHCVALINNSLTSLLVSRE
ncbi:unnamed protein product, partial [Musa banksii]